MAASQVLVVDASAVAALVFGEPQGPAVAERLGDATLVAPLLLPFEVSSVCRRKVASSPDDADRILAARALVDRMDIQLYDIDHDQAVRLAVERSLTAYDAAYLWLARRLGAELVTLDAALARAAG